MKKLNTHHDESRHSHYDIGIHTVLARVMVADQNSHS